MAVDTNVLARAVRPLTDESEDARQSRVAGRLLREAETIYIATPTFCELAWVLRKIYRFGPSDIVAAIRALLSASNVECDRHAVRLGLQIAESGGDFADGVIAETGFLAGADRFVSFDRRAVQLVSELGRQAELLA